MGKSFCFGAVSALHSFTLGDSHQNYGHWPAPGTHSCARTAWCSLLYSCHRTIHASGSCPALCSPHAGQHPWLQGHLCPHPICVVLPTCPTQHPHSLVCTVPKRLGEGFLGDLHNPSENTQGAFLQPLSQAISWLGSYLGIRALTLIAGRRHLILA